MDKKEKKEKETIPSFSKACEHRVDIFYSCGCKVTKPMALVSGLSFLLLYMSRQVSSVGFGYCVSRAAALEPTED